MPALPSDGGAPPVPSRVEPGLDPAWIAETVARALDEDLGVAPGRDVTTQATVPPSATGTAHLVARADGVVAGLVVVEEVTRLVLGRGERAAGHKDSRGPRHAKRFLRSIADQPSGVASALGDGVRSAWPQRPVE